MHKNNSAQHSLKLLLPLLASIIAISPLAIDMYLPAMPILAEYLNTTMPMVQNSLSVYLLGFALGLILFGPMADKYSRRKMVLFGISGFSNSIMNIGSVKAINKNGRIIKLQLINNFISSSPVSSSR